MDTFLAIASRREDRAYDGRPLPDAPVTRILDAGRLAGSASNRQAWTFVVVESPDRIEALAETVYEPANLRGARLVVAIVLGPKGLALDAGRAAQNMLLAAWNEGVGGSPNGLSDRDAARAALGLGEEDNVAIVLSFGYPAKPRDPQRHTAEEWSRRRDRKPLSEVVRRI